MYILCYAKNHSLKTINLSIDNFQNVEMTFKDMLDSLTSGMMINLTIECMFYLNTISLF